MEFNVVPSRNHRNEGKYTHRTLNRQANVLIWLLFVFNVALYAQETD